MSSWRECKLGEIISSNNQSIDKKYIFETIEYLDTGSITNNKIDGFQQFKINEAPSRAKRLVKHKDIVYSTVRPIQRHFGFIENSLENLVVSTGFSVIETNQKLAYPKFIYYFLSSDETVEILDVIAEASTSTYPSLKPSDIENLDISLPPLKEQKAIAEVLSSLDDKIDLLHRQNKTLEELAQTLFRQWFIEEAGDDWDDGTLSYFANNPRKSIKPAEIELDIKYIGLEHIERKNISLVQSGDSSAVASNKYQFEENDILFGKLRPYFHKVCFTSHDGICSTDILVIRPKKTSYFAYTLLAFNQEDVINYANACSEGTRMPRTNWKVLSQYPVQIPSEHILEEFNLMIMPSIKKIKNNQTQIKTLENMRDTLLPKLMSGEVRVEI